jgi:metal-sulfur cluster biosynthetic enzyme
MVMGKIEKSVLEKKVWKALSRVDDPELSVSIVDLGLIYGVKVSELKKGITAKIKMTLTSMGCPLAGVIESIVIGEVKKIKEIERVVVELVWEPVWTTERIKPEVRVELLF